MAKTPVCHTGERGFNPRRDCQFRRFCLDFATRSKIKGIKDQSGRGLHALHIFEKHLGPVGVVWQVREVRLGYPPPISVILTRQL